MAEIFISHSSVEHAAAAEVAEALRQAGHNIFLDSDRQDGIMPGADWSRTLFHKLRLCDAVVFLNSSGSQASKWCHTEVVVAADLGKRRYWLDVEEGVKSPAVLGPLHGIRLEISLTDSTRRLVEVLRRDGLAEHSMARWDESRSPYPGLEAMDVLDAGVFFGREADVHRLVERVAGPLGQVDGDLVVVVGPSGAGKSSLVRAGLAARLASAGSGWAVLEPFEPGLRPLDRLVKRLVDLSGGQLQETTCRAQLGADGLGAVADRLLDRSPAPARRLLVTVDQAEQLATVGQGADRETFVAILATALGPGSPVTVVMTVRSDRFEEVHGLPVIGGAIHESFVVASLDRSQLAAVIEGPARRADMTFETGLVGQLIDDAVRGGSDNAVDSLPLLAFTLREVYDLAVAQDRRVITAADYEQVGRIEGAIALRADAAEALLSPGTHPVLEELLPRFVTVSEQSLATGRPVALDQLSEDEKAVVQKLEDQRLLTGDGGTVRLAHERLITAWPALAQVVTEHKEDMVLQARLERQAADWEAGAGELLGRDATETATLWLAGHADHATAQGVVGQYVRHSKAALSRRREARASALAVIIALGVAAASVAAYAVNKNSELSADARTAISDEVATEAVDVMPTDAVVGTLLSLESLRLADSAPARSAVLEAKHQPIDAILGKGNEDAHPVVLSPGGRYWATGATSGQVTLWDMGTGNELGRPLEFFRPPGPGVYSTRAVTSMAFSPDGETLAIGDDDGEIVLWDVATSKELGHPLEPFRAEGLAKVGQGGVFSLAFSPKGDTLASGDGNGDVVRWDVATGQEIGRPLNRSDSVVPVAVGALAFSPDGKILASGNDVGDVVRWDLATGQEIGHSWVLASEAIIDALAFSPDGKTIATGDDVGGVQLWDVATGTAREPTGNLTGGDFINSVAFSPGGKTLATGDETGDVKLWDVATGTEIGHAWSDSGAGAVQAVAFSSDGATVESGEENGDVVRWDVGAAHEVGSTLTGPSSSAVDAVDFSPNGQILASGDDNGDLVLWDVATERQRGKTLTDGNDVSMDAVAFSPNGQILASGDDDGDLVLWDVATGRPWKTLTDGNDVSMDAVAFSPNGQILASLNDVGDAVLWDVATGKEIGSPLGEAPQGSINGFAFSPNGQILASGDDSGDLVLWDVATGKEIGTAFNVGSDAIFSVAFSPDGRTLAIGTDTGEVLFWDVASRSLLGPPRTGLAGQVNSVVFSPRGDLLAVGEGGNTFSTAPARGDVVLVPSLYWDPNFETASAVLCPEVRGNLTRAQWAEYVPDEPYQTICPGYA